MPSNNTPITDQAEAADPIFLKQTHYSQGRFAYTHGCYTHHKNHHLTGAHIKIKEDIEVAFHALNLCTHEEQKSDGEKGKRADQSKYLSDSVSSNDNEINPRLKTSVEERQYNTIPGSAKATCIALSYSRVQGNPTIERGPPCQNAKTNKPPAEKTKAETSSTSTKDK